MLISRKNAKGGRFLQRYPLVHDNGALGYKIGYCSGCNEPIVMKIGDTEEVIQAFDYARNIRDRSLLKKLIDRLM